MREEEEEHVEEERGEAALTVAEAVGVASSGSIAPVGIWVDG
jgi:hypothetical protein